MQTSNSAPCGSRCTCKPVFQGCEVVGGAVAEALFRDGLCLPSGTAMTEADLARVVGVIKQVQQTHW